MFVNDKMKVILISITSVSKYACNLICHLRYTAKCRLIKTYFHFLKLVTKATFFIKVLQSL